MSEEKLALNVPIGKDGFPLLDFMQWDYSGNPNYLFAAVYELDRAMKDWSTVDLWDADEVAVVMRDGKWVVRAPELFSKHALYTLARIVEQMAGIMIYPVFVTIHEARLNKMYADKQIIAPPTGIMVPGIQ